MEARCRRRGRIYSAAVCSSGTISDTFLNPNPKFVLRVLGVTSVREVLQTLVRCLSTTSMSSVPSSQPALPTYASVTTSRLKSLYSDFTYQKHSNPTSYASNVEWWRHTLEAAQLQGWLSESRNPTNSGASPDRLVLHAYGVALADKFRAEGVGKPLSIPTVIVSACISRAEPVRTILKGVPCQRSLSSAILKP